LSFFELERDMRTAILTIAIVLTPAGLMPAAAAEPAFGGHEAAIVDWAFANCGLVGTPKERDMASAANAKGGDAFGKAYRENKQKLTAQTTTPQRIAEQCEQITSQYGPEGTVIAGLLGMSASNSATSVPAAASAPASAPTSAAPTGHRRR
jgi:hypothetical protein